MRSQERLQSIIPPSAGQGAAGIGWTINISGAGSWSEDVLFFGAEFVVL